MHRLQFFEKIVVLSGIYFAPFHLNGLLNNECFHFRQIHSIGPSIGYDKVFAAHIRRLSRRKRHSLCLQNHNVGCSKCIFTNCQKQYSAQSMAPYTITIIIEIYKKSHHTYVERRCTHSLVHTTPHALAHAPLGWTVFFFSILLLLLMMLFGRRCSAFCII